MAPRRAPRKGPGPGDLPRPESEGPRLRGEDGVPVLPDGRAFPPGSIRRGHLSELRLRTRARGSVRELREAVGSLRTQGSPVSRAWHDPDSEGDGPLFLQAQRLRGAATALARFRKGHRAAPKEWAKLRGTPEGWRDFWYDPQARHYYFIGQDNIVFHTIIWPAILLGYDDKLVLPYDVPATKWLNISGERMTTGRGRGVWLSDLLAEFDPDQLRYYALATMPETKDTDFSWEDFAQRNNSELLAIYGNFVHRAMTFADRHFDHAVPEAGFLDATDKAMIRSIEQQWKKVGQDLAYVHLKDGIREAVQLARLGDQDFDH